MTNNLRGLKKELKSFAKRVKDFKYTDSALIAFLLTGIIGLSVAFNAYSAQDEIEIQRKAINTSITDIHQQFKRTKSENDKLMKNYNLELIQLMEQGDHVVKSPWSSWQYGINGIYNDWQGHYKGRGDKTADVKYERDKTLSKYKYNRNPAESYGYGNTTELGLKQEPNAVIPVSASLTPLTPKIKNANLSLDVDLSSLPNFQPRTIEAPEAPNVNAPTVNININLTLNAKSKGSWQNATAMKAGNTGQFGATEFPGSTAQNNGVFEGVAILNGTIDASRSNGTRGGNNPVFSDWTYTVPAGMEVMNVSLRPVISSTNLGGIGQYTKATLSTNVTGFEKNLNGFFQSSGAGNKYTSPPYESTSAFLLNTAKVT